MFYVFVDHQTDDYYITKDGGIKFCEVCWDCDTFIESFERKIDAEMFIKERNKEF